LEAQVFDILKRIGPENEKKVVENLTRLTKISGESYYSYIGRLLLMEGGATDLVQIKLADRLDNTLDMRIDLQDPLDGIDFFETIFQTLFVKNYKGYEPAVSHPASTSLNGARRLYQLFKNAVLLSLIRQKAPGPKHPEFTSLFNAVATASLKEAQRTLIHLVAYHHRDSVELRNLLFEAMAYCYSGRSDLVTKPDDKHELDGLFSGYFGFVYKSTLNTRLDILYQNKPLMIQTSIAFITIFLSFLNDESFYIRGISSDGIQPA
jgi:hypothetical protein